jgi:replicative DNA helicase
MAATSNPRDVLGRVPPHAETAEQAVLGSVLFDSKALVAIKPIIGPEHFYLEAHRAIFEAMLALEARGLAVDTATVAEQLAERKQLDRIGGNSYLDQLIDVMPVASHVHDQAVIIREKSKIRGLILDLSNTVSQALDGTPLADLHRLAARAVNAAAPTAPRAERGDGLRACLDQDPRDVLFLPIRGEPADKFDLGAVLGGFSPGEKLTIAGETNSGKTGFVIPVAVACADAGYPTGYFALEDPQRSLEARAAGVLARLSPRKILDSAWTPETRYETERVLSWFKQRGFYTFRMIGAKPEEVCNAIQAEVVRLGLRVVIVDYLQAASFSERTTRTEQIDNFVKGVERAGNERTVSIFVSQLRRRPPGDTKRPTLDDLRDSGAIGHLSRTVIFVNKEGEEEAVTEAGRMEWRVPMTLDIAKNKGPMGPMPATMFRPQSFVWPGATKPVFRWEADAVERPAPEQLERQQRTAPPSVQEEIPLDAYADDVAPF